MKYSENYHLYLPEGSDFVTPEQYNDNFKALDTKLKAVETAAESVVGHTHGMADIKPETVDEVSTFNFSSPFGSYPALKMSRPGSGYSVEIGMNGGAVDIRSWSGDVKNTALRILCGGGAYAALKLIDTDSEGEAKNYLLFGQHNLPHFTGGYTGDGASIRSVNLNRYGRIHKPNLLLIFATGAAVGGNIIAVVPGLSEDELGSYSECTVIKSNGSTVQSTNLGSGACFSTGKSKLEISGNAAANLLNVSGVSYYYWGDRT
ncbi:hypothetical protein [Vermiculatibacterium agrestimuris]|uniref:hypothetical protein n=1 Tax=Vermiculatibacterium agrestimuris TaxID=2941519 RepID=UPI0020412E5C|nr:hypothetical protein [Vermiculatibacterium agrestimuris]